MTANSPSSKSIIQNSSIKFDVSIKKQVVINAIEQEIDKLLSQQEDVEHNYYKLHLKRASSIELQKNGSLFQIEFSLSAQIFGVGIMKKINADGIILLKSTIEYQIDDTFIIYLHPRIQDPTWLKLPSLNLGRKKINILKIVNVILNNKMEEIRTKISNSNKLKIELKKIIEPFVKQYNHQSIAYKQEKINIALNPQTLHLSDLIESPDHYDIHVEMNAIPTIYDSNVKLETTALNSFHTVFNQTNNGDLASLFIQASISYPLIKKMINEKLIQTPIELLGKQLQCSVINITSINGETIKIDIQTDHKTLKSFTLQCRIVFDSIQQKIELENIDIQLTEANLLGKAIMLLERPIINYFSKKINPIQLQAITANIMTQIDANLEQQNKINAFDISLQKENILIESIDLKSDQLMMLIKLDHLGHIKLEESIQLPIL